MTTNERNILELFRAAYGRRRFTNGFGRGPHGAQQPSGIVVYGVTMGQVELLRLELPEEFMGVPVYVEHGGEIEFF